MTADNSTPKSLNQRATHWLASVQQRSPKIDKGVLTQACLLVQDLPSFPQALIMAEILMELRGDTETIASALIYPAASANAISREVVNEKLSPAIQKLVSGVQRMQAIHQISQLTSQSSPDGKQIENLRKMLLAMVDDIRTVLIKLAERLALLELLAAEARDQQIAIAQQTLHIYAPLANRLGIGHIKSKMEDLAFRYLHPEDYQKIHTELAQERHDRDTFLQEMITELKNLLKESNLADLQIKGRAKHIYSIFRKMQKKRVNFSEIYDTIAFRIIVPSVKDCYTVLGMVHSAWEHIPKEFDDYIAKPKANGYQSIHTVVITHEHIHVEMQIRTKKMNDEAELGVAAHWKYKETGKNGDTYANKISLLQEVMDWQKELTTEKPGGKDLYSKIFSDRVYVFTPEGDIYDLPGGATPLDFAYHLHSDVGHHCRGAKVNGALVPLSHAVKTGDQIQILTDKNGHPSRDWLNPELGYLKTSLAKNKVRHWFRKENYQENLHLGHEIWDKAARRENITKAQLQKVAPEFNLKNAEDLIAALGAGDLTISNILHHLKPSESETAEVKPFSPTTARPSKPSESHLHVAGIGNLLTQLARCCKPIPGDLIVGYITKGKGVTIHQQQCANIQRAQLLSPQRIIIVDWGTEKLKSYPVDISVEADDRAGLIRDITAVIANENIPIVGINSRIDKTKNIAHINITIEIPNLEPLHRILNQIRIIPDIIQAFRI